MRRKLIKRLITLGIIKVFITIGVLLFFAVFSEGDASAVAGKSSEIITEGHTFEKLDPNKVTTKSLSEKWLPAITFTICNMQNRNGYSDIIDLL